MLDGQVITGGIVSTIVTVKLHWFVFPPMSVAVQVTVLRPTGKIAPLGGAQLTLTPAQLSPVLAEKDTAVPPCPPHSRAMLAGQLMVGGVMSRTITGKEHVAKPDLFVAEQVTMFVPTGKTLPEAGVHVTAGLGVPVTIGAKETTAEHWPTALLAKIVGGQTMVGGVGRARAGKEPPSKATLQNRLNKQPFVGGADVNLFIYKQSPASYRRLGLLANLREQLIF